MSSWIPSLFNPSKDVDNPGSPSSGVKEDLSSVFRGVSAFLAPPPSSSSSSASSSTSSDVISGIKSDLSEIQGSFRSGLSLISSKFTSNLLPFNREEDDEDDDDDDDSDTVSDEGDVVGVNEEVVGFVRKISGRPELWTDFPLSLPDDFNLSDYQREHAASIDHLVPELVTLRQKSCSQISNEKFWLIYFILLFPRLNEEDLELLLTPEVVEARETLLKKLEKKTDSAQETPENHESSDTDEDSGEVCSKEGGQDTSQHKDLSVETTNSSKQRDCVTELESGHDSEEVATSTVATRQSENSEFSFSDLEDEETDLPGAGSDKMSTNESSGVEGSKQKAGKFALKDKESEGEDSNDWHTVDDTDFDNLAEI